ncbi:MAG TPA: bifunctional aspartate kinase/homoserine dehydrogenase I [Chitinophagaceae bacterium]|nr:bifunctional aspartate kinase/homoserine dehydrogenase I [Chitinophagaceae bacterium]
MQVLKFGGTSVANAPNISRAADIIQQAVAKDRTIVVISALGGITDLLLQCGQLAAAGDELYLEKLAIVEHRHLDTAKHLVPPAHQSGVLSFVKTQCNEIEDLCKGVYLLRELSARTIDSLLSYGELIASRIVSARLHFTGLQNAWKDARELIRTDSNFTHAAVHFECTNKFITEYVESTSDQLIIVPGFVAFDAKGITTTLGRGGSDYTASILAAATKADRLEIWTDVSGMMTADPRLVTNAKAIRSISYQEAMELSHFGAKVVYPPTIQPVMRLGIPVWIRNTFAPEEAGTVIQNEPARNGNHIRGISSINKIALLSLEGSGMVGIPGFSRRLFEALANEKINVILITQASSEHSICVGVEDTLADKARQAVDKTFEYEISTGSVEPLTIERELAIVALVGDNMKNHPGVSGKMFGALGRNGVNVRAIAQGSSERNISAVIAVRDVQKAINVLHEEFFENTSKQLNLFIAGTGNVGSKLMEQLKQQQRYLQDELRVQLKVRGLANSRKMVYSEEGIDLDRWSEILQNGQPMNREQFIQDIQSKNLRNAVFADVTASEDIAGCYHSLLEKSIAVVACNKIACSSSFRQYKQLKSLSREYNAQFLFETNVGAGLPVIGTLNSLLQSGDQLKRIEAVLSGTLNYVFNNYNAEEAFADVVKRAQDEGYTEPDPRLDLGGTDVMRKIMILAREAGEPLEMEHISNHSFMPASCMEGDVDHFYSEMHRHEEHFRQIFFNAFNAGKKLKFVAKYEDGKGSVGLQQVSPDHGFYHLYGKDNVVLFYTNRYVDQPLMIKGAGAGAEVTASGVFADIIRAARV